MMSSKIKRMLIILIIGLGIIFSINLKKILVIGYIPNIEKQYVLSLEYDIIKTWRYKGSMVSDYLKRTNTIFLSQNYTLLDKKTDLINNIYDYVKDGGNLVVITNPTLCGDIKLKELLPIELHNCNESKYYYDCIKKDGMELCGYLINETKNKGEVYIRKIKNQTIEIGQNLGKGRVSLVMIESCNGNCINWFSSLIRGKQNA